MIFNFLISEMLNGFRICQRGTSTMVHELMIIHTNTQKRLPLFRYRYRLVLKKNLRPSSIGVYEFLSGKQKKTKITFFIFILLYI